jgi:hypothetical protein
MQWGHLLAWLWKPSGCLSLIGFFMIAGWTVFLMGPNAGFAVAGIVVVGTATGALYVVLGSARRLSRVVVEVSDHPLQAGKSHEVEIWHADPRTLADVRLRPVSVERSGRGKSARTKTTCGSPVLLTSPAPSGGAWKGRLEVPPTAVSFGLDRDHHEWNDDEDLDEQVKWHLELRARPWHLWVVRYPVEIHGPAANSLDGPAAQLPTRLQAEDLTLWIDSDQATLAPGAVLTGGFEPHAGDGHSRLRRVEFSVVFVTRSKARSQEKLDVCHFEEHEATDDEGTALLRSRPFRAILPGGPPTFSGQVFQISWAVRVRLFYRDGKESAHDLPFRLLPGDSSPVLRNNHNTE